VSLKFWMTRSRGICSATDLPTQVFASSVFAATTKMPVMLFSRKASRHVDAYLCDCR
jgi:hypothetical protein